MFLQFTFLFRSENEGGLSFVELKERIASKIVVLPELFAPTKIVRPPPNLLFGSANWIVRSSPKPLSPCIVMLLII